MMDGNEHDACVDAWLQRAASDLTLEQHLARFERAFAAVLVRAHQTLGEVTVMAVLDRVLYVAAERYPLLSKLEAGATRVSCRALLSVAPALPMAECVEATRFVLVEFLTVLGKLTAEILTPALHGELVRDVDEGSPSAPRRAEGATHTATRTGPSVPARALDGALRPSHAPEGPEEAES